MRVLTVVCIVLAILVYRARPHERVFWLKRSRLHFVTYGCDRFTKSKARLKDEVEAVGMFDTFRVYEPGTVRDMLVTMKAWKTLEVLRMKRGGGYWIWKPLVIWDTLNKVSYGDIVVYADAGCTVHNKPGEIASTISAIKADEIGISNGMTSGGYRKEFNRMDVVNHFVNDTDGFFDTNNGIEHEANRLVIHKTPASMAFVKEWVDTAIYRPNFFTDEASTVPNHAEFIEHRHDQSVFNCIAYKRGMNADVWPIGTWLDATRIRE